MMGAKSRLLVAAMLGVAVGGVGFGLLQAHAGVSRVDDGPTYTLSDFKIEYPWDDPRPEIPPDKSMAAVGFAAQWPKTGYPGYADCTLILVDSSGSQVASFDFTEMSGSDGVGADQLLVPVNGAPSNGTATCKRQTGQDLAGPGYVVSGPTEIAPERDFFGKIVPDKSVFTFDVRWAGDLDPVLRICTMRINRADGGSVEPQTFTLLDKTAPLTIVADVAPKDVADATVDCGLFAG